MLKILKIEEPQLSSIYHLHWKRDTYIEMGKIKGFKIQKLKLGWVKLNHGNAISNGVALCYSDSYSSSKYYHFVAPFCKPELASLAKNQRWSRVWQQSQLLISIRLVRGQTFIL